MKVILLQRIKRLGTNGRRSCRQTRIMPATILLPVGQSLACQQGQPRAILRHNAPSLKSRNLEA